MPLTYSLYSHYSRYSSTYATHATHGIAVHQPTHFTIYIYVYIYIGVNPQCLEFDESQPWASILKSKLSIGVYIRQFKTIYSTM
jgi:hypothetical protein